MDNILCFWRPWLRSSKIRISFSFNFIDSPEEICLGRHRIDPAATLSPSEGCNLLGFPFWKCNTNLLKTKQKKILPLKCRSKWLYLLKLQTVMIFFFFNLRIPFWRRALLTLQGRSTSCLTDRSSLPAPWWFNFCLY